MCCVKTEGRRDGETKRRVCVGGRSIEGIEVGDDGVGERDRVDQFRGNLNF